MSRTDLIELEGMVTRVMGRGTMEIQCDNDVIVRGVLSGRMKKNRIKVIRIILGKLPMPKISRTMGTSTTFGMG